MEKYLPLMASHDNTLASSFNGGGPVRGNCQRRQWHVREGPFWDCWHRRWRRLVLKGGWSRGVTSLGLVRIDYVPTRVFLGTSRRSISRWWRLEHRGMRRWAVMKMLDRGKRGPIIILPLAIIWVYTFALSPILIIRGIWGSRRTVRCMRWVIGTVIVMNGIIYSMPHGWLIISVSCSRGLLWHSKVIVPRAGGIVKCSYWR